VVEHFPFAETAKISCFTAFLRMTLGPLIALMPFAEHVSK
jgi:hypothetical protein